MATAKRFNITVPEKYNQNGEEKTKWNTVGTYVEITKDDGSISRIVEIPAIGLKANAFPYQEKQTPQQTPTAPQQPAYQEEITSSEDIPF